MKNKKIILFIGILLLVIIFFITYHLRKTSMHSQLSKFSNAPTAIPITKSPNATSLLSIKQLSQTTAAVTIDAGSKAVTAVQIEISYDPDILANAVITPGAFFSSPFILSQKVDPVNKTIFLALAVRPGQQPQAGQGSVAIISFTPNLGIAGQTSLQFTSRTKVTSQGVDESVLKDSKGITISL